MFTRLTFNPSDGLLNTTSFPTTPDSETEAREQLQELHDQERAALNGLMTQLEATDDGSSGADSIGVTTISGVTGNTAQAVLEDIKTQFDELVAGEVDPATILTTGAIDDSAMFDAGVVDGTAIADDAVDSNHIAAGAIDPEHLSTGCVGESAIDTGAVTTNKVGTAAITPAKTNFAYIISASTGNTFASYPAGISYSEISATNLTQTSGDSFPCVGTLITVNSSASRFTQILIGHASSLVYTRTYYASAFSAWMQIPNILYGTSATPPSGTYPAGTVYYQHA